jgi:hypothetical protein
MATPSIKHVYEDDESDDEMLVPSEVPLPNSLASEELGTSGLEQKAKFSTLYRFCSGADVLLLVLGAVAGASVFPFAHTDRS